MDINGLLIDECQKNSSQHFLSTSEEKKRSVRKCVCDHDKLEDFNATQASCKDGGISGIKIVSHIKVPLWQCDTFPFTPNIEATYMLAS